MKKAIYFLMPVLILIIFSGCITIPISPTARLADNDSVELGAGIYHVHYDYTTTSYSSYNNSTTTSGQPVDTNFTILEARLRPGIDTLELGVGYYGYTFCGDLKFSPMDQKGLILLALDGTGYFDLYGDFGGGLGAILNIVPSKQFEIIFAGYEQYMYGPSANTATETADIYATKGLYTNVYGGIEWHILDNFTFCAGGGLVLTGVNSYTYQDQYDAGDWTKYSYSQPYYFGMMFKIQTQIFNTLIHNKGVSGAAEQPHFTAEDQSYYFLAKKYMDIKDYKGAEGILLEGLKRFPDDYRLNEQMGTVQYRLGDRALAGFYYEKALSLNPGDAALQEFIDKLKGNEKDNLPAGGAEK